MDYPWYELLEDSSEITQGDIVKLSCPNISRCCKYRGWTKYEGGNRIY